MAASLEEKQLLDKLWETYELSHEAAKLQRWRLSRCQGQPPHRRAEKHISALGNVNVGAIEEFQRINERYTYLTDQRDDVETAKKELEDVIMGAEDRLYTLEYELFCGVRDQIAGEVVRIQGTAKAIAGADVFTALSAVAMRNNYVKPKINERGVIHIRNAATQWWRR